MATIGTITACKFIGNPMTLPVTAGSYSGNITFQNVRIEVEVYKNGTAQRTFEFSEPATGGTTVYIDISSAFQALAEAHEYVANPSSFSYPYWTYKISSFDDYLKDGEEVTKIGEVVVDGTNLRYTGRMTDRERLLYKESTQEFQEHPSLWTRKPKTSPEICFIGNPHLTPGAFGGTPYVTANTVAKGKQVFNDNSYEIYGINQPADGFELRFINSLGVHENVFITCLRQSEVNIKNDFYTIARRETLTKFSRGVSVKQNDYETWKMSSGPVDFRWQQWWLHEPLMAKWAWLNVDSQWLPVHIVPEETTVGIDRAKGNLLEVQFTLRFDINGSPFK